MQEAFTWTWCKINHWQDSRDEMIHICPLWSIPTSNIHIHRSDTCLLDHHHQFSHCLKHTLSHISPEDVYPMRVSCKLDTENWCRWSYYTSIPMWSLNDGWSRAYICKIILPWMNCRYLLHKDIHKNCGVFFKNTLYITTEGFI